MTADANRKIEDLYSAFAANGYIVYANALPGEEEVWAQTLANAFAKVEETIVYLRKTYGYRGKSKRLMAHLHQALKTPDWGIEVRED